MISPWLTNVTERWERNTMEPPVIIVGAGPTGLMLAGELGLAGVNVVVLERLQLPTGESRGLGFGPRTMEIFEQRGLLPDFGEFTTSSAGHFGGLPLDFSVFDGAHFNVNGVPQSRTEQVLTGWLTRLGVEIRRGVEVTGLDTDDEGVTVHVATENGSDRIRAGYLVGCDGGRSTIRSLAGFTWEGTDPELEMYLADVAGCVIEPRPIGQQVPGGMAMAGPIGNGIDRVIACELGNEPSGRTSPPTFVEVAAVWERLTGEHIADGEPIWVSRFTDASKQATEYRRGRVLLAGDAAHICLPAGGQGMNTGVQDATNLGWKLAAQAKGQAPEGLLDTYHTERHPVGRRLLINTRAQAMLNLGGDATQPMRTVLSELITHEEVARHLAGMVSGLDIRYDTGSTGRALLGGRIPHVPLLVDGAKSGTAELLHNGKGVLLSLTDGRSSREAAEGWIDRVDVITATPPDAESHAALGSEDALLIRPDGHVMWTSSTDEPLVAALTRWFGAPSA